MRKERFYKSLLNPKICLGGCGFELEYEYSVCKDKPKGAKESYCYSL